jgi:hypothetical protein
MRCKPFPEETAVGRSRLLVHVAVAKITRVRLSSKRSGTREDPEQKINLRAGSMVETVVDRMIAILQNASQR